jgi:hypothetical protein
LILMPYIVARFGAEKSTAALEEEVFMPHSLAVLLQPTSGPTM